MSDVGITSYASYLPAWSLDVTTFGPLDEARRSRRRRSVRCFDEDAITMAVAALARLSTDERRGDLAVATSSPPYLDKSVGATVHAAVGGDGDVRVSDFSGLRSGATSLSFALRIGGVVVAADERVAFPGSGDELHHGDAAVAFDCGPGPVAARLISSASATDELLDQWRLPGATFSSSWDERFTMGVHLERLGDVAHRALDWAGIERATTTIVASTNGRAAQSARKIFGASRDAEVELAVGNAGAAHGALLLADALDRAEPGDTILFLNAADGADAFLFGVTNAIASARRSPSVREQVDRATAITYERFLRWRGLLDLRGPKRPEPDAPAAPPMHRRWAWKYALTAARCEACDVVAAPPVRVCPSCGAIDSGTEYSLRDQLGTIVTVAADHLSPSLDPPATVVVVDVNGGGRRSAEVTDVTGSSPAIGDVVAPTFRKISSAGGIHNYFWKVRPLRRGERAS